MINYTEGETDALKVTLCVCVSFLFFGEKCLGSILNVLSDSTLVGGFKSES